MNKELEMDKVFVLGLDGATPDIMMPMIEKGELPAFKEIIRRGAYGRLKSTIPPISPPAWTAFATGKNPGKNGILGFTRMIPNSYQLKLMSGADNQSKTLWELLSQAGKKVIVMNVPMTYPPRPVNGLLISGLDTPDIHSDFTYPAELKQEILSKFPEYKINLHLGGYLQTDRRRKKALQMIYDSIETRYRVADYIMDNYPWDFFIVKFNNPDIVQHHFWKYMDPDHPEYQADSCEEFKQAIFTVYKQLDRVAASIMKRLDPKTTLVVLSDHGAGPRINKTVYINEWLRNNGYLSTVWDTNGISNKKWRSLRNHVSTSLHTPVSFMFRHTSPGVRIFLKNMMPGAFSTLSLSFKYSGGLSSIDWSKTIAFLAEEECIRMNVKGVYPQGILDKEGYFQCRSKIIRKLKQLKDPETRETIFEDVLSREDAFYGSDDKELPDIKLVTREAKYDITGKWFQDRKIQDNIFVKNEKHSRGANGMHRYEGVFFINGPYCLPHIELENIKLIDVCPTILFQMGIPIPKDMDGTIMKEAFHSDFLTKHPICYEDTGEDVSNRVAQPVYSAQDESKIVDHLRSLGYIE